MIRPLAPKSARRAFTLIEMMLAVTLGSLVIFAALGLFTAVQRSDERSKGRLETTNGIIRTHIAVEKAVSTIITSDAPAPAGINKKKTAQDQEDPVEQERREAEEAESRGLRPRFLLEYDPGAPSFPVDPNPDPDELTQRVRQPQRLEVAIRATPIFDEAAAAAERIRESLGGDDPLNASALVRRDPDAPAGGSKADDEAATPNVGETIATDEGIVSVTAMAPGVRGVFEIGPDPDHPDTGAVALYWRQTYPPPAAIVADRAGNVGVIDQSTDDVSNPDPRGLNGVTSAIVPDNRNAAQIPGVTDLRPGSVKLAVNLAYVTWEVYKDSVFRDEVSVVWWDQVPGFVRLELKTMDGRVSKWMLEIAHTEGPEPGEPQEETIPGAPDDVPDESGDQTGTPRKDSAASEENE